MTRTINGIKFADGVDTSDLDMSSEADSDLVEALRGRGKIRITTMIDEDVYAALKERATADGDGRYQTYLNSLLRKLLLNGSVISPEATKQIIDSLRKRVEKLEHLMGPSVRRKSKAKSGRRTPTAKSRASAP